MHGLSVCQSYWSRCSPSHLKANLFFVENSILHHNCSHFYFNFHWLFHIVLFYTTYHWSCIKILSHLTRRDAHSYIIFNKLCLWKKIWAQVCAALFFPRTENDLQFLASISDHAKYQTEEANAHKTWCLLETVHHSPDVLVGIYTVL